MPARNLPHDGKTFGRLKVAARRRQAPISAARTSILDEEGFFDTGDVATIDEAGYMQITDRSKDVIKSGGEWISSIDLENLAVGHPAVAEAAVIGVPSQMGRAAAAGVQAQAGPAGQPRGHPKVHGRQDRQMVDARRRRLRRRHPAYRRRPSTPSRCSSPSRRRWPWRPIARMTAARPGQKRWPRRPAASPRACSRGRFWSPLAPAVLVAVAALGVKFGLLPQGLGYDRMTLDWAPKAAVLGVATGVAGLFVAVFGGFSRYWKKALGAVAITVVTLAAMVAANVVGGRAPPVHDVATDWSTPLTLSDAGLAARGTAAPPIEADPSLPIGSLTFAGRRVADVNARPARPPGRWSWRARPPTPTTRPRPPSRPRACRSSPTTRRTAGWRRRPGASGSG
jgi:hypothetical protein